MAARQGARRKGEGRRGAASRQRRAQRTRAHGRGALMGAAAISRRPLIGWRLRAREGRVKVPTEQQARLIHRLGHGGMGLIVGTHKFVLALVISAPYFCTVFAVAQLPRNRRELSARW